jgi:uncharacterized protein (TIGR02246 family)
MTHCSRSTRLVLLLACTLVGSEAAAFEGRQASHEEAAVTALWRQFETLYSQGDYKGVASLYAPDADRGISGSTEIARGRCAIEQMYKRELAGWDGSHVHDTIRVRFLRPDVALLDGFGPDSEAKDSPVGIYTVVLEKRDGRWMIAAGRPRGTVVRNPS